MNTINDIYEWMELYLLEKLDEEESERFEKKLNSSKEFAEDFRAMEIEMYEEGRLPTTRKKMFEERLKNDAELANELALHIATFEIINLLDNQENIENPSSLSDKRISLPQYLLFQEKRLLTFFEFLRRWFQSFFRKLL